MASVQYERKAEEAVELSYEEKVSLDELIKQAESADIEEQSVAVVAGNEGLDKAAAANIRITAVAGALKNQTKGPLNVVATKKWAGHIVKSYSNPLNSLGAFAMSAIQNKGVKAAVVYSGKNKAGVETAWLLAFADTKDLKRRVYAEGGPKKNFININWDKIEQNLNKAGTIATAPGVYATIAGTSGGSAVAAAFTG